jgi:hypothetical protein
MTAPIGNAANRFTGIREFSQVTNSYGGYLQSGGVAYNITLPFFPDKFEWFNYTKFGTDTNNIQGVWYRDFPSGDALIIDRGTTTLTSTLETTNGITDASTAGGFTNQHLVISGITAGVVTTTTNHNLSDGDRVVLTKIIGTVAAQLNNNTYVVDVLSATTFKLYDVYGVPIVQSGTYTSSGQVTKMNPALGDVTQPASPAYPHQAVIDYPPTVILTLGSAIMGADNDVIYFTAWKFNNYVNLGDVA